MRFDTKEQAVRAAAKINQMFAKRGHRQPVVQAVRGAYWWEVQEIPTEMPGVDIGSATVAVRPR